MTTVYPASTVPPQYTQQPPNDQQGFYGVPPGQAPPPQGYANPGYYAPPGYNAGMPGAVAADQPVAGYNQQPYSHQGAVAFYGAGTVAIPIAREAFSDSQAKPQLDPKNQVDTGRWSAGLCDCCNSCVPNLCMSWCCPCVSLAQIYARVSLASYNKALLGFGVLAIAAIAIRLVPFDSTPTYTYGYDADGNAYLHQSSGATVATIASAAVYAAIQICFALGVWYARSRVRGRFQIPGNCCCDCLISWLCSCCAIAQMATHVKSYTPGNCSFGAPDVLPAFP